MGERLGRRFRRAWLALAAVAGTALLAAGPADAQRYPSVAECAAGHPPNAVFYDTCGDGYRICPNGSKLGFSYCIPMSDGEKAEIARQRRVEEERRQKIIRDKAEFDRQVADEVLRMGAHRRAEAERLVRMRQAADAARPKPPSQPGPTRKCTPRRTPGNGQEVYSYVNKGGSQAGAQAALRARCSAPGIECGAVTCRQAPGGRDGPFFACSAPHWVIWNDCGPSKVSPQ